MIRELNNNIIIRIISALIVVGLMILGYWWLMWIVALVFLFFFKNYYEIILWGIAYDAIYSIQLAEYGNFRYIFTVSSIILYVIGLIFRKRLIVYDDKN